MVAVAAINSVRYVTADCSSELTSFVSCDKEEVDLRIVAANKESELKEVQNKIDDCYKR